MDGAPMQTALLLLVFFRPYTPLTEMTVPYRAVLAIYM